MAAAAGPTKAAAAGGERQLEHEHEQLEPDRYAMHALQAAYVRSVGRTRLDLMKTLGARREAALVVPGADGIPAAQAAAMAAGAATPGRRRSIGVSSSRGSSSRGESTGWEGNQLCWYVCVTVPLYQSRGTVCVCVCVLFVVSFLHYCSVFAGISSGGWLMIFGRRFSDCASRALCDHGLPWDVLE